ncbi:MAG TPA: universal stress protein [Opitutaceae bacterium]|nr:universal stress protein [Opitutaceae bacterium]
MKTILTPIDFSRVTQAVVDEAAAMARAFAGRVILLHVAQPPVITSDYGLMLENIAQITAIAKKAAARQLARLRGELQDGAVPADSVLLTGSPVAIILDQAKKLAADYIVIGSHGHTAFYDLLIGSTASGVLKKALCPVIIVPLARTKRRKARKNLSAARKN